MAKVALVTGGGSGIGEACAHRLARDGAAVLVEDIDLDHATAVADAVTAAGGKAEPYQADVSDAGAVEEMVQAAVDRLGGLDIAVNTRASAARRLPQVSIRSTVGGR
jgi:3-hydroxybutyrate dehydrogenase